MNRDHFDTVEEDRHRAPTGPRPINHEEAAELRAEVQRMIEARKAKESNFFRKLWRWAWAPLISLVLCATAPATEVPDRILHAIAEVETATDWHPGDGLTGPRGSAQEASVFQLSPAVLRDLHAPSASYVHSHPAIAEALTREWLARLYTREGSWAKALAAYHAGVRGWRRGRDYARRVMAIAAI